MLTANIINDKEGISKSTAKSFRTPYTTTIACRVNNRTIEEGCEMERNSRSTSVREVGGVKKEMY